MKSRIAIVVAATLLGVGASGAWAGEVQYQVSDTARVGDSEASHAALDRTALIGTGRAAATNAKLTAITNGTPASPHWTASIGTGHVSGDVAKRSETLARDSKLEVSHPHWTSKIGTGHAADSGPAQPEADVPLTVGE